MDYRYGERPVDQVVRVRGQGRSASVISGLSTKPLASVADHGPAQALMTIAQSRVLRQHCRAVSVWQRGQEHGGAAQNAQ